MLRNVEVVPHSRGWAAEFRAEADRLAAVLTEAGISATRSDDGLVTSADTTPADVGARAFAAGIELHELRAEATGLEELYFRLTAGQEQFAAGTTAPGATAATAVTAEGALR